MIIVEIIQVTPIPNAENQEEQNRTLVEKSTERMRLLDCIDEIDKISDREWKAGLAKRKLIELGFHDRDRDQSRIEKAISSDTYERYYGNKKYYVATRRSRQFVKDWIAAESKDKVFLDYACGNGGNAILAAQSGASSVWVLTFLVFL